MAAALAGAACIGLTGCARTLEESAPAMGVDGCQPGQVRVLVLGTFHFAQQDRIDVLAPDRQAELGRLLEGLARFAPDRVAVESPWTANEALNTAYDRYLAAAEDAIRSPNETYQVGFRLARRLGHERVFGVDVPILLWDDSIQVFDDEYPTSRRDLRRRWGLRYPSAPKVAASLTLEENLRPWNAAALPAMPEFGLFMPLVEGDIYAGALKMRPWYDRNLRIVQNLFRILEPGDERLFLIIGGSHVRVLRHLLDATPQLCAVDPLPYLSGEET